jgi:hypothetical protein
MFSKPEYSTAFRCVCSLLCLLALAVLCTPSYAARAIVNVQQPDNEITDRADLRAIFTLRKRQWSSGAPVKVYVLPDTNTVHDDFVKQKLHLYPYQLRQIWNRLVFSGTGVAPVEVETEAEVVEAVLDNPYAIGYVNGIELPAGVKEAPLPTGVAAELADGVSVP